jgi:GAF domain-containing protein
MPMVRSDSPTPEADPTEVLAADFLAAAQVLFSAGSVDGTLAQVAELAVATIEGCDMAGIFLLAGDVVTTPVHTDPLVVEVDALQHSTGEGPCLGAIAGGVTQYAADLSEDSRWSVFGPLAARQGLRSLLAVPLRAEMTVGALNLYARYPSAFGVIDRARAQLLAAVATMALTSARTHEAEDRRADNLTSALVTRELIGQAQGILMERERITANEAFVILRRASQHLNRKLRDVAQNLVETGERPDTGTGSS